MSGVGNSPVPRFALRNQRLTINLKLSILTVSRPETFRHFPSTDHY
jgi:hypothetical protein